MVANNLRRRIWERDHGICQVCGLDIIYFSELKYIEGTGFYECGHQIDRMVGGDDADYNLVVMCMPCNRLKPIHETYDEYLEWVSGGYWVTDLKNKYKFKEPDEMIMIAIWNYFISKHFTLIKDG